VFFGKISGSEVKQIVAAPGEGKGRKHPRIAVNNRGIAANNRGEILLEWTEGTAWQRGGAVAWQIFDAQGKEVAARGSAPGVPVWSFGAVAACVDGGFRVFY
jgi:hypothetical protein